ncbi:MAG: hypothetical protein JW821_11360 [Deltaproteobacteria bacterium]|nr:hypothetical protein [Deltaproteobacteria bacterium]
MNSERHPVHRKGDRNPFCPHYSRCLDHAVSKSWNYWDCSECRFRGSREGGLELSHYLDDSMPYYDLPTEIFEKFS